MNPKIVYTMHGRVFYLDGKEVTEAEFDAICPDHGVHLPELANNTPKCWPMVSQALAVHPKQVAAANARNKKHGVHVQYDQRGIAHIPDRGARRDLNRLEAMHDNDAGYGD